MAFARQPQLPQQETPGALVNPGIDPALIYERPATRSAVVSSVESPFLRTSRAEATSDRLLKSLSLALSVLAPPSSLQRSWANHPSRLSVSQRALPTIPLARARPARPSQP